MKLRVLFLTLAAAPALSVELPPGVSDADIMTGDDRWGCELLLCLANPNGWATVAECHPPVEKYFDCRSKRHPCEMPKCPQAGEGNYAQNVSNRFDPCKQLDPALTEAPVGWLAEGTVNRPGATSYNWGGDHWSYDSDGDRTYTGSKACVKPSEFQGYVTQRYRCGSDSDGTRWCTRKVAVYSSVTWQRMQTPRAIDVYINGEIWQRVHW